MREREEEKDTKGKRGMEGDREREGEIKKGGGGGDRDIWMDTGGRKGDRKRGGGI